MNIAQAPQKNPRARISSDDAWPLRRANGKTWAEDKRDREMDIEMKIATQIVDDALAAGYALSVQDGEEITVTRSKDRAEILGALRTTDHDRLFIHGDGGWPSCWVMLIWGNDVDVISDYAGPDEIMAPLLESAQNIADQHSA